MELFCTLTHTVKSQRDVGRQGIRAQNDFCEFASELVQDGSGIRSASFIKYLFAYF